MFAFCKIILFIFLDVKLYENEKKNERRGTACSIQCSCVL